MGSAFFLIPCPTNFETRGDGFFVQFHIPIPPKIEKNMKEPVSSPDALLERSSKNWINCPLNFTCNPIFWLSCSGLEDHFPIEYIWVPYYSKSSESSEPQEWIVPIVSRANNHQQPEFYHHLDGTIPILLVKFTIAGEKDMLLPQRPF